MSSGLLTESLFNQRCKVLLEKLLFLFIGLWVKRAWHQLSPLMPLQQSVDRRLIYFMSYSFLKGLLDLRSRRESPFFASSTKGVSSSRSS